MDTTFFMIFKLIRLTLHVQTWLVIGMVMSLATGRRSARPLLARWSGSVTLVALLSVGILLIGRWPSSLKLSNAIVRISFSFKQHHATPPP